MMTVDTVELSTPQGARTRRGSFDAFRLLVECHRDRVYRVALRISGNTSDAEEIAQQAFLRAYQALPSFQGAAKLGTWLYRIAINEALMRQRAARRRPVQSLEVVLPHFGDVGHPSDSPEALANGAPDRLLERKELGERIQRALDELDEAQRAAFVLRDLEGLPVEEVASILHVSPDVVRQRAHRARLALRERLACLMGAE